MKKLSILTKTTLAALVLVTLFAPAVLAAFPPSGPYCIEISSDFVYDRPFTIYASQVLPDHFLINGTFRDPSTSADSPVTGNALFADDGTLIMTLRASAINSTAMNSSTYHLRWNHSSYLK